MTEQVDVKELIQLCALDTNLFERTFFPKTFRQIPATFARAMNDALDGPERYVNLVAFRGSAKTTKARAFAAKRIAYGVSRTILYIGKSENHALRSSRWIRMQIERNSRFRDTFGLRKGTKWQDHEFEVMHGVEEHPITVIAMGVTGSTRGVNVDDYRPDFIILDDIIDDQNAATPDSREKMDRLVYGALWESLAPASENASAKILSLATPQNSEDYVVKAMTDPQWKTIVIPCWTKETMDAPLHLQKSAWPERWSDETLRAEKAAAMARNQLSTWNREKECRITSRENASFRVEWLKRFDLLPKQMNHILVIDPVPPPSEIQVAKGLQGKDYEAFGIIGVGRHFYGNEDPSYYLREIMVNKGHEPDWSEWAFEQLTAKYKPLRIVLDMTGYQRTLKWILEKKMRELRRYYAIIPVESASTSKYNRIIQGLLGVCAAGEFYIPPDSSPEGLANSPGMAQFVSQFTAYPNVSHDDALEVAAIGVASLSGQLSLSRSLEEPEDEDDESGDYLPNPAGIPGRTIAP